MHSLVRQHRWFFLGTAAAGLALRLFFFFHFPAITDDTRIYGDLATNWLRHGVYGETQIGQIVSSDSRLPGYPAFLAAIFALCGDGNFKAAMLVQIFLDLATCLAIADLARRMISGQAARIAFFLAALCPFLAAYSAAALTETLEILFTVLALDLVVAALDRLEQDDSKWQLWASAGACVGACILLRPDGGLLLAGVALSLAHRFWQTRHLRRRSASLLQAGVLIVFCALAPLLPWTLRNFRQFQHFQPLAPRYAQEQDELVPRGFNRWVKTWIVDYTSVEEVYWNVPGDKLDPAKLPNRAFDSPAQRDTTLAVIADYNQPMQMSTELDARFGALAAERVRERPVRYYICLPVARIADMWLRPRTELMPADPRWWEFNDARSSSIAAVTLGIVNLAYVTAALLALLFPRSQVRHLGLLLTFLLLRSAFLGTLENPEPRYTLECCPVVMVLASAFLTRKPHDQAA